MNSFKAYQIQATEKGFGLGKMTTMNLDDLDPGEVSLRVHYSSINYKDALAATGKGKIIRRFPCVGGIDMAGVVTASADPRFKPGDPVIATSFDIGVAHHGGYAEMARVPARWVLPLPAGMSLRDAMYHAMTGEPIDGKTAAAWKLVTEAVPLARLRARVSEVAQVLLKKNPVALKATKDAVRRVGEMSYDNAEDYLVRAQEAANSFDDEGRKEGIRQFIDAKTFKPGIGTYDVAKRS